MNVHETRIAHASFYKTFTQLKKWSYLSFANDDVFVGGAIVELNYVSEAFLYVVDLKKEGKPMWVILVPFFFFFVPIKKNLCVSVCVCVCMSWLN